MNTLLHNVASRDGTRIAYEQAGSGPAIILIGGALCDRNFAAPLATLLREQFTVISYDRRGRGDSGDTQPYAAAREVEDLEAVIGAVGGPAYLYGVSSGAILAFEAAASGLDIAGLALVEPPYAGDGRPTRPTLPNLGEQYTELCSSGRRGEAVELFITKAVGQPPEAVEQVRASPMWPAFVAIAHTLAYDAAVVGDAEVPTARAAEVEVPALGIGSAGSPPWLTGAAQAIARALPNGRYVTVDGEFHQPYPEPLAKTLRKAFLGLDLG